MKARYRVSAIQHFRSSTDHGQSTVAIYETISSHPGKTEGDKHYDVLDRKQLSTSMDSDIIHAEADINSYSKLKLNDDDIKPEKNPAYITTAHIKQSDA